MTAAVTATDRRPARLTPKPGRPRPLIPIVTGDVHIGTDPARFHAGKRRYRSEFAAYMAALGLASDLHHTDDRPDRIALYRCPECAAVHIGTQGGDVFARVARREHRAPPPPVASKPARRKVLSAQKAAVKARNRAKNAADYEAAQERRAAKAAAHALQQVRWDALHRERIASVARWLDDGGAMVPEWDRVR